MFDCKICNLSFKKKGGFSTHLQIKHSIEFLEYSQIYENFKIPKCEICGKDARQIRGLAFSKTCGEKCAAKHHSLTSQNVSKETRNKLSSSMKKAHAEGRANNWQDSKKYDNSSYPEVFFSKVIENEFNDKDVKPQHRFFQYSIDFAWVNKKLAIEIDGKQHEEDQKQKESDTRKDKLLIQHGWKVLRIRWVDMFHEPKKYIEIAKNFIEN